MLRVNLFGHCIFMIHNVIFCCSPVDGVRFEKEFRERFEATEETGGYGGGYGGGGVVETTSGWVQRYESKTTTGAKEKRPQRDLRAGQVQESRHDDPSPPDWWVLLRPLELAGLIKRYHMAGNCFLVVFVLHMLVLFHLTIKSLVHAFVTRNDPELLEFFDTIYYPHITGFLQKPHRFNQLLVVSCAYVLGVRFRCAYQLIRGAIVNANGYKEIRVSQVNLGAASALTLTLDEWRNFFKRTWLYDPDPKGQIYLKLDAWTQEQVTRLSKMDLMYYLDVMDFSSMFEHLSIRIPLSHRKKEHRNWHCAYPMFRGDIYCTTYGVYLSILGSVVDWMGFFFCIVWAIYSELRSSLPHNRTHGVTFGEVASRWHIHLIREPTHLVRLLEFCLFCFFLAIDQFDAIMVYIDSTLLVRRIRKLVHLMEYELDRCGQFRYGDGQQQSPRVLPGRPDKTLKHVPPRDRQFIVELNKRIERHTRLAGLMFAEFTDLKRSHSLYINIMVICCAVSISYSISLLFTMDDKTELMVLFIVLVASLVPLVVVVVLCAFIERAFQNLYRTMTKLLLNNHNLLLVGVVERILVGIRQFESEDNRSFLLCGLYSITLSSVAPFFAFMATATLYLDRFSFGGSRGN